MKNSRERILTTHVGSLPRPAELLELFQPNPRDKGSDSQANANLIRNAVAEIVHKQAQIGLDIIDDGEFGKPGFITYVSERLGGFEPGEPKGSPWAGSREAKSFPEFYEQAARSAGSPTTAATQTQMVCTGPIKYKGQKQLQRDIENLKIALNGVHVEEVFMPAISPSNIEDWQKNKYYKTGDEFLFAIADAMHEEYRAIVDAGFLVQIDDPRLITYYLLNPNATIEDCRKWAEVHVEAINHALRGIPEDRVRFHTCYSINMGPRVHDMELKDVVDIILKIHAGAYSFEAANPRHEHEWQVWQTVKLPEGKILIPGVITQSSVVVEHPELVAQRILRYAKIVGRGNVIAGADCGFSSFAGSTEIHPTIVWAKLKSLVDGARLATKQLWR
ncbi:MAG: cobalamin-independent methionine synthase II family protein [Acidobacteriia bacterium]|nr:cobalamin-independent methionine synthase II family protein [Terriglobia bacterium]